ncbi:MAG: cytochrome c biogenesis protein CcsA [Dinghuibacter sp.]|nr:cytochrome c biogenesis protein CcsA [Dinghuibacter sp.]
MHRHWWKILSFILLVYTVIAGFLKHIPSFGQNAETTRNVFFHVPMWFGMILLYSVSLVYSLLYLRTLKLKYDHYAAAFAGGGTLFGVLGLITGMVWARTAWGHYWQNDPKQVGAALTVLMYLAYFVLRRSVTDGDKKGRISSVYNVFSYFMMFPAIYIIPGLMTSSHPGGQGDEPLMVFKMDPSLRLIFYPAVIGWTLLGAWIATLRARYTRLNDQL